MAIKPQNYLENQLSYAEGKFQRKEYFDAITEYKRLDYFDKPGKFNFVVNMGIGKSYKAGGKYSEALRYFREADINAITENEKFESQIEMVRVNILRKTTDRALEILESLEKGDIEGSHTEVINYWRGWAMMFDGEWTEAADIFGKIGSEELKVLCDEAENDKYSVTFARVFSYILPGSGQFYTGNYLSGLLSLGWNGLWGFLTIRSFIEDRPFDGFMIGGLLWLRFYRGNYQNAEKFALTENKMNYNRVMRYLMYSYNGMKP